MQQSSKRSPCPVCGRTKDADCRWNEEVVLCHLGTSFAPPQHLKLGDTIAIDGKPWALVKTNAGFDGSAFCFKPHREREATKAAINHRAIQAISDLTGIEGVIANFRSVSGAVLDIPPLEQLLDSDIRTYRNNCEQAEATGKQLIARLTRAKRHDPSLGPILTWVEQIHRDLRYQLADLNRYCANPGRYWREFILNQPSGLPSAPEAEQSDWHYWNTPDPAYRPSGAVAELFEARRAR